MPVCDGIPPLHEPGLGWAFACSCRGASHRRSNRPCQDACAIWAGSCTSRPFLVAAVADGHGDRQHDLSHLGALFAVRAAVHELSFPILSSEMSLSCGEVERIVREERIPLIMRRWREEVLHDSSARFGPAPPESEGNGERMIRRYGTTLLAAAVRSEWISMIRIGDGDLAILRPDGRVEFPIPDRGGLIGTVTNSLSSRDALSLWQTSVIPREEGGLLLLATDGLSDSFGGTESAEFGLFLRSLGDRIAEYGMERVSLSFPSWLERYSELGSGDDITIAMVRIEPAVRNREESVLYGQESKAGEEGGEDAS